MKRVLTAAAVFGMLGVLAFGQDRARNWLATTSGQRQLQRAFTAGGLFGVPRYATASLPTCDSTQASALMYDSTLNVMKFCNGTANGALAGSGSSGAQVLTDRVTFGTAADAANAIDFNVTAGGITFEGSGVDAHELTLTAANAAGDVTVTIPATATTLAGLAIAQTFSVAQTFSADIVRGTSGRSLAGTKTLADASAVAVARVAVASGAGTGGILQWTVFVTDATDHQAYSGQVYFSAVNKASAETCTDPTIIGTALLSASSGTLTCTYACDETPADAVDITLNCNTSLQVAPVAYWELTLLGPGTITAQ